MSRSDDTAASPTPGAPLGRILGGVLCLLLGGVWIAQGTGHLHGSFMTGETRWTVIGVVVVLVGVALLGWSVAALRSRSSGR